MRDPGGAGGGTVLPGQKIGTIFHTLERFLILGMCIHDWPDGLIRRLKTVPAERRPPSEQRSMNKVQDKTRAGSAPGLTDSNISPLKSPVQPECTVNRKR